MMKLLLKKLTKVETISQYDFVLPMMKLIDQKLQISDTNLSVKFVSGLNQEKYERYYLYQVK